MQRMHILLLVVVGLLVGTFVIALGSGGGSIYVGLLTAVLGLDPAVATATALVTTLPSLVLGTWGYYEKKHMDFHKGNRMLISALPSVIICSIVSFWIPKDAYGYILASILFFVGGVILYKAFHKKKNKKTAKGDGTPGGAPKKMWEVVTIYTVFGILGGIMAGIGGMSGGEPIFAGLLLLGDDVFETISTSSWVVICMGILGASVHLIGGHVDWRAAIPLTIGATCGALIAPHVARFITKGGRAKWLEGALGLALIGMGIKDIV
ncbi:MAG: sulfite exporter TauE/SafE family protein [Aeriscardovia sp.]|nr:sulfite exporter TauE/SafE family protein [Aeriscardovia sp.]